MTNLDLKARANELAQETQKRIAGGCYCEPGQGPHYYDFEDAIAAAIRAGMRACAERIRESSIESVLAELNDAQPRD